MRHMLRRWRAAASVERTRGSADVRPSRDVFCTRVDDRSVLLDLRSEQYVSLDEVGSTIWEAIERGITPSDVVHELAQQYDAPPEVLARDTQLFVDDLQRRGLLESGERSAPRPPRLLICLALLALMDVYPRMFGMRRTFALVRLMAGNEPVRHDASLVDETTRRLVLAAAFYPRRALCLEQSLALCVLLRRRGIPAELKLGARPLPFYAHTWVEVDGRPVDERSNLPLQLATFSGLGV